MNPSIPEPGVKELCMLVLNIAPALEEDLIDYLLTHDAVDGFTSCTVYGHGQHQGLSTAEQVTGKRKRLQYEMLVSAQSVPGILAGLATSVGLDIVYWQQAVSNFGRPTQGSVLR